MNREQRMVREFHDAIGAVRADQPTIPPLDVERLRVRLIEEELDEFRQAAHDEDFVKIADALGDLLYVVYGAADAYGIDMESVFAEIHRSNMTKVDGPRRADGKILKSANWSPPRLEGIIPGLRDPLNVPGAGMESRDG